MTTRFTAYMGIDWPLANISVARNKRLQVSSEKQNLSPIQQNVSNPPVDELPT